MYLGPGLHSSPPLLDKSQNFLGISKADEIKSQHGCGRWAPKPHLTPPCSDFACSGLMDSRDLRNRGGWKSA